MFVIFAHSPAHKKGSVTAKVYDSVFKPVIEDEHEDLN